MEVLPGTMETHSGAKEAVPGATFSALSLYIRYSSAGPLIGMFNRCCGGPPTAGCNSCTANPLTDRVTAVFCAIPGRQG
jgi:hypothetical protein